MLFTGAELSAMVGQYAWPFVRIAALVGSFPIFSSSFIPVRIRLVLALVLTMVVAPITPPVPEIDAISINGFLLVMQQVLIGITMGFIFHLVMSAFVVGGQIVAMQMGLGFSTMIDPVNGSQTPVLSMLFLMLVTLLFLLLDGHLAVIQVLAQSFHSLPIGLDGIGRESFWEIALWGTDMFKGALMVSLPAVTALLLVNIALGVMGRAAPQLNIFAVGFSITISGGFYIIMLNLPMVLERLKLLSLNAIEVIKTAVGVL